MYFLILWYYNSQVGYVNARTPRAGLYDPDDLAQLLSEEDAAAEALGASLTLHSRLLTLLFYRHCCTLTNHTYIT